MIGAYKLTHKVTGGGPADVFAFHGRSRLKGGVTTTVSHRNDVIDKVHYTVIFTLVHTDLVKGFGSGTQPSYGHPLQVNCSLGNG